jgi:Phosphotransferase enzyme family
MHAEPALFHRDIRWPNVLWSSQNKNWFLIDFDDASMAPTRGVTHLSHSIHHPRVFQDGHGAEVDIWAVGRLILDAVKWVVDVSEELRSVGKNMVEEAMTAEQALICLHNLQQ